MVTATSYNCPKCDTACEGDRFKGHNGRTIETLHCPVCDAEFGRYEGQKVWILVKQWEAYTDEDGNQCHR